MSQDWLRVAGDKAEQAAEETDDDEAAERLHGLAEQLWTLADRERGPDHGRIARIENIISEIEPAVSGDAADALEACRTEVVRYRETVEGV